MTRSGTASGLRYERIALAGGWSALVLRECHNVALEQCLPSQLPTEGEWRALLDRLVRDPAGLDGYALLKYSDNGEVLAARSALPSGNIDFIAKQSRPRGLRRGVAAMLRPTRARRNFVRASHLLRDGIGTAVPLALVERGRVAREAWLVSVLLQDLVDLDQIALTLLPRVDASSARRIKDRLIERVAALFARLQWAGWHHRDLKASNVMLTNWDRDDARAWLVDLDGLRRGRRRHLLDLRPVVRLAASLQPYRSLSTADGARFVRKLMGSLGEDARGWHRVLRTVAAQAGEYNRRAQGRKTGKLDGFGGAV